MAPFFAPSIAIGTFSGVLILQTATAVLVTVQTSIFKLFRAFVIIGLDWTYHAHQFILVFLLQLLFVPWYTKLLSWLPVSLLLHVKYTAP